MKNPVGKPLPLTLLEVMTPCHLHDPKRMALPDDTNDTLGHFATGSRDKSSYLPSLIRRSQREGRVYIAYRLTEGVRERREF